MLVRNLSPEERALNSERFRQNFSDDEREMLRTMSEIGPRQGDSAGPPPEQD